MKKPPQAALVGAGSLSDGPLGRLSGFATHLGPVKAVSLRVASRLSNALRAGHPVAGFEDFEPYPLIFISVPDDAVPETVEDMVESGFCWKGRLVVLCSNTLGVEMLAPLAQREASIASFGLVPGFEDWFLLEGEKSLERVLRPMMGSGVKATLVGSGQKFLAVQSLAKLSSAILPIVREMADTWRGEFSNSEIERVMQRQFDRMLRTYFRSGRYSKD